MRIKAHLHTDEALEESHLLDLRRIVEGISAAPDHVLVYPHEGTGGGLMTEFAVEDAPQASLLEDISRALMSAVPGVYDVGLSFRD
ncbi:MAG: hypothetical protein EA371_06665 [Gammaproteobacteria bacterium]|nr:MAG: hypothetical protein EA371_06665 [Gammaproteobacteria bacterium]